MLFSRAAKKDERSILSEKVALSKDIIMRINNSKELGEALRKRRKELGYTQKYIGEFSGYSTSFISDVENGKATAEIGRVIRLASLLGIDIELNAR